jgi:O-antigen ligase
MTIYFWYALVVGIICSLIVIIACLIGNRYLLVTGMVTSAIVASPVTTFTYGTAGAIYPSDMVSFFLLIGLILPAARSMLTPIVPQWYKAFKWYMIFALVSVIIVASFATSDIAESGLASKVRSVPFMPLWMLMMGFRVMRIIFFMLFFSIGCRLIMDEKFLKFVFKLILITISGLAICQILDFLGIKKLALYVPWEVYQQAHILGHPKASAGRLYVMGIFLAMSLMYRSWKIGIYFILLTIITTALLFSGSRAALIGITVGFMFFVYKGKMAWKVFSLIILALVPIIFIVLENINPERVESFSGAATNPSQNLRWPIWEWTIKNLIENPYILVTGVGFSNFRYALIKKAYAGTYEIEHAHNDYLTCLTEMGLFGLMIFIWYLSRLGKEIYGRIKYTSGHYHWQAVCVSCILTGLLASSLFEFSLYYSAGSVSMQRIFAILVGSFTAFWAQQDANYLNNSSVGDDISITEGNQLI